VVSAWPHTAEEMDEQLLTCFMQAARTRLHKKKSLPLDAAVVYSGHMRKVSYAARGLSRRLGRPTGCCRINRLEPRHHPCMGCADRRPSTRPTGAGGDNGIATMWNRWEISVSSACDRSHDLHPRPCVCCGRRRWIRGRCGAQGRTSMSRGPHTASCWCFWRPWRRKGCSSSGWRKV
jgi:hypothetical protein